MRRLTPLAAAVAVLGLSAGAFAQTTASQRVEITGSSIKRIAAEGALPVQVITRQDLERQGIVTAEQLIGSLSAIGSGLDNLAANSDVVAGARRGVNGMSCANLRMQGCEATLILLNGRRVAAYGLSGGIVDVQSIPMAAVERVEVLKDGASAIYGTDAIGGVINFILRKDYQGLEAQAFTDVTQHGGGNITRFKLTGGFGDLERDGFNVLAALSRSENKMLRGDQRDFVNTFQPDRGLSVDTRGTPVATLFTLSSLYTALSRDNLDNTGRNTGPKLPGGTQAYNGINILDLPGGAGCESVDGMGAYDEVLWASPAARFGCAWDTGRAAVLQQPVTNTNAVLRGTLRLGEHQVYGEFTGAKVESKKSFSPNQISSSAAATSVFRNLAYPSTGASYDRVFDALVGSFPQLEANRGQPMAFRWRCMPCGDRAIDTESDSSRFLIAADGPIAGDWSYRTGASRATSKSTSTLGGGFFYGAEFARLINTGVLDPFSLTQTPEALAALQSVMADGVTLYGGKYVLEQVDATVSGPVARLPGGDVMLAVGTDLRREKYRFNGNETDLATQARIFNAPFDSTNTLAPVKRDVKAVFAEVQVPVTKQLELNLAARYDDYSGFGSTTNPKATLLFKPAEQLALRASYGTGFRVPTFSQLFFGTTESPYSGKDLVDPTRCPDGKVSATPGCELITPTILTGQIIGTNKVGYQDFTPIASLLNDYVVFAVRSESALKTGSDLVASLKKDPKSVSIGFATALGSHNHIAAGLLMKAIGGDVKALKVLAFKGSAEAITGVLGGHIDLVTTAAGNAAPHVAAGRMRILGIAAEKRMPGALANVPTWKEQGVPIAFGAWRGIMGPKGMTAAQIAYWETVLKQVVATPEWKADLERNFWADDFITGAKFAEDLKQEYGAMKTVLTDLGLAK